MVDLNRNHILTVLNRLSTHQGANVCDASASQVNCKTQVIKRAFENARGRADQMLSNEALEMLLWRWPLCGAHRNVSKEDHQNSKSRWTLN
jgi:hypothetical protein